MAKTVDHKYLTDLRIPYQSYGSPISTDPDFSDGANVLTNLSGVLERRPGFATGAVPGTFTGTIKRIFVWHRVAGTVTSYFAMVNSCDDTQSYVYKFKFGTDAAAVLIHTDTTSNTPFDFVTSNQMVFFGKDDVADQMWKYDGTNKRKWGIAAPAAAPTIALVAGSLNITSGWFYRTAYGSSATGHVSSVSPLSACTSRDTSKKVQVTIAASADAQVDRIHVYRTTDGGSTNPFEMQELPNSPFSNANATIDDTATDLDLQTVFAPALYANDPPPPLRGFIVFQNRIGGFTANKFYYSGFEEIANGVGEESWPSGLDGNHRPYPSPIYALAPTSSGAGIFTKRKIYGVDGDSLDTFRWGTIIENRGAEYPTAVLAVGGSVVWLDTSKQIWLSDIGEMGKDIRPDSMLFDPTQTQIAVFNSGEYNWVLVLDGENEKIYPANMDNMHWMVPWPIAGVTAIASGETADGTVSLLAAIGGTIYKLTPGTYLDGVAPYGAWLKTNLFNVAPEQEPDFYGVVDYVALETDSKMPSKVAQLNDDDSSEADNWVDLTDHAQDSTRRAQQGVHVIRKEYPSQPATANAQRVALWLEWPTENANFKLYSLDIKHHRN
jgi:hypothetical protein